MKKPNDNDIKIHFTDIYSGDYVLVRVRKRCCNEGNRTSFSYMKTKTNPADFVPSAINALNLH